MEGLGVGGGGEDEGRELWEKGYRKGTVGKREGVKRLVGD